MIIVTARMKVKSGQKRVFIEEIQDLISATRQEKGCISYDLYSSTDDEDVLIMFELWEDMEDLNSHVETDHYKRFGKTTKQLLANEIEVKSYSVKAL